MPNFDEDQIIAKATARFQRVSARKARLVADLIRGKTVRESQEILAMTHRPSAVTIIGNLLKSVLAGVDRSEHPEAEDLVVGEIQVNGGPIMYRMQPRARGRSFRIRKRYCHVSMKLVQE